MVKVTFSGENDFLQQNLLSPVKEMGRTVKAPRLQRGEGNERKKWALIKGPGSVGERGRGVMRREKEDG